MTLRFDVDGEGAAELVHVLGASRFWNGDSETRTYVGHIEREPISQLDVRGH